MLLRRQQTCSVEAALFDTADRPVILGIANDALWRKFCRLAQIETAADDPRFATNTLRVQHRGDIELLVTRALQPLAAAIGWRCWTTTAFPAPPCTRWARWRRTRIPKPREPEVASLNMGSMN